MSTYDILYCLALALVIAAAGHAVGYRQGRREEERCWRFAGVVLAHEIRRADKFWTVMERDVFFELYHNPLARLRFKEKNSR